jgi:hypothetical protein
MNQRGVTIIAAYLAKRPLGRLVRVRKVGHDDFMIAIEDRRDGRTQLIHSSGDLRLWLDSFRHGECLEPVAAICARCDKLHRDRDVDGELLLNCIPCMGELTVIGVQTLLEQAP